MTRAGVARLSTAFVASVCLSGLVVAAQGQGRRYSATLVPGQENPALAAPGQGTILLDVNEGSGEIGYLLSYQNLTAVTQAHIHFEKPGANGGIMLWLCQTATNPAPNAATPVCPADSGSVSGILVASDVRGIAGQRLTAGDLAAAVDQIRNGLAYANVHTTAHGGGQIRGQIQQGGARN